MDYINGKKHLNAEVGLGPCVAKTHEFAFINAFSFYVRFSCKFFFDIHVIGDFVYNSSILYHIAKNTQILVIHTTIISEIYVIYLDFGTFTDYFFVAVPCMSILFVLYD